ncbi:MAG: pullulanase [Spirochaetaceae bacterium]|nr:pullulanase [Spirochaetaceae bacterium]
MNKYNAWKVCEKTIPSSSVKLGCYFNPETHSASFSLWAPTAEKVRVLLYEDPAGKHPAYIFPLQIQRANGVWSLTCSIDISLDNWFYDFEVTNEKGTRICLDPYALSMTAFTNNKTCGRAAVINLTDVRALPPGGWSDNDPLCEDLSAMSVFSSYTDAVVYEVSVRDFTISADSDIETTVFVRQKGSYNAFIQKLPYLKKLGMTHIQLLPVMNFYYNDETNKAYEAGGKLHGNNYNWGYDPHNYFTPEGWFASDPYDQYCRISELKNLIKESHRLGLRVILDVVYNHMADADLLDNIVPNYYFRLNKRDGSYTSASGCGNDVASERAMARRLIIDSLCYFVKEYHVDGFRFDLMGLLDSKTILDAYDECLPFKNDLLFIGEGWKMYNGEKGTCGMDQNYMKKTQKVSVFNDEFRDLCKGGGMSEQLKGFITGGSIQTKQLFNNICGNPQVNYTAEGPARNVQYLECHDGLTLHDNIIVNLSLDESNELHRKELFARIMLAHALLLTSQGIIFLHAGQEYGRSKPAKSLTDKNHHDIIGSFVKNSYNAPDSINNIIWHKGIEYEDLRDFTRILIALRKKNEHFRIQSREEILSRIQLLEGASGDLLLCYKIMPSSAASGTVWYVIFSGRKTISTIDIDANLSEAQVYVYGPRASLDPFLLPLEQYSGSKMDVPPLSAVIFSIG